MSIAIMQPYFFPYIGYFQLMKEVDVFVIADDLKYIKNGFINKNFILIHNEAFRMSLQLKGASQNKLINEIEVGENSAQLLETIRRTYKKAPFFNHVFPLIESILLNEEKNLARYLGDSLINISNYLEIEVKILYSSNIDKNDDLKLDERIMDICQIFNENHYVNSKGGKALYKKEEFAKKNIRLDFIHTSNIEYMQYNDNFISDLSIIDLMMFNSKDKLKKILCSYELV